MISSRPKTIHGEPSVGIETDEVTAWLTLRGAHLAPVVFRFESTEISPLSLAPWLPGEAESVDPVLAVLRGDFWCMPFGTAESGADHGAPANETWHVADIQKSHVHVQLRTGDLGVQFDKVVSLRESHSAVYQEVTVKGLNGAYSYGTHPVLDLSSYPQGSVRISSGPIKWASVVPGVFSSPNKGETQILEPGSEFVDLNSVAKLGGGAADISRYPSAVAHEDLVMLSQIGNHSAVGWTAASAPGFAWISLKNIVDFPSTLLWMSNGGRTQPPWGGRHVGRLGVEDCCSYFHLGLSESRKSHLSDKGIPTIREFVSTEAATFRWIQVVIQTPTGFGRICDVETVAPGMLSVTDEHGTVIETSCDWHFVLPTI